MLDALFLVLDIAELSDVFLLLLLMLLLLLLVAMICCGQPCMLHGRLVNYIHKPHAQGVNCIHRSLV